jgi:transcriptional regulator with XRE-family HTH domain
MKGRMTRVVGFAPRLRALRVARGFTQEALAEMAGLKRATVTMFENEYAMPSLDALCGLADALGVTTDELLGR